MTHRDEELGFPGNREIVERALRERTTQVLHLAAETGARNRTLAERGADLVRGMERVPAEVTESAVSIVAGSTVFTVPEEPIPVPVALR